MQWLINIIKEWIVAEGYLLQAAYHRGDPNAFDFILVTFVQDGAYHTWDLSAIVPAGAKFIVLNFRLRNALIHTSIKLRHNGNVNEYIVARSGIVVAGANHYVQLLVACDTDRKIQYNLTAAGWLNCDGNVVGWIF